MRFYNALFILASLANAQTDDNYPKLNDDLPKSDDHFSSTTIGTYYSQPTVSDNKSSSDDLMNKITFPVVIVSLFANFL
jgi:hypothetical protein